MNNSLPYSENLGKSLSLAASNAENDRADEIDSVYLLYGMYSNMNSAASKILIDAGIQKYQFDIYFNNKRAFASNRSAKVPVSTDLGKILASSQRISKNNGFSEVYTIVALLAVLKDQGSNGYKFLHDKMNINAAINKILSEIKSFEYDSYGDDEEDEEDNNMRGSININGYDMDLSDIFGPLSQEMGKMGMNINFSQGGRKGSMGFNPGSTGGRREQRKQREPKDKSQLPDDLLKIGTDFTQRARDGKIDPVIGREFEIQRLIEILCRKTKNNPVLIGEPGVGKSAIAEGLALRIVSGNVPELLQNKIIFSLEIGSLMAGTKYRGELEERLKKAIEILTSRKDIICFIDEFHTLVRAGGKDGEVSPSDMLKPYLARGEMQTIGATTTDEYRKFVEEDKALERRFQPILVNPPTIEQTIEILKGIRPKYEEFHKIKISDEALVAAANLSERYISDRFLPDKAIDLIDEASSRAKINIGSAPKELKELEERYNGYCAAINEATKNEDYRRANDIKIERDKVKGDLDKLTEEWNRKTGTASEIGEEQIADVISRWTKIPVSRLTETELEKLNNLESILHKRVVGQDDAVSTISKAIRRSKAGLHDPNRPIGTFLFLGPTGVGKTELSKAVAESMFDSEDNIIRIDMSEYMEAHSVSKLIGAPPGYVGFDDGGQLTEQVRRKQYSVVLFDEIEKAHPDVYNLLLQILDEGRLTDSKGRTVNFKNTIIIMTSNVGIANLKKQASIGFGTAANADTSKDKEILENALKAQFKPEFLNRIDSICYFNRLKEDDIRAIADILFNKVTSKLKDKNIKVQMSPAVVDYIIKNGYDVEYGARPLKRVIEQSIEDTLAEALLSGKVKDGDTVNLDYDGTQVFVS